MKLTSANVKKAYSEQLENLLQQGYDLVGKKEIEYLGNDKINPDIAVLSKNGKCFELGFWVSLLSQKVVKWTMALTNYTEDVRYYQYREEENQLENPFSYYQYSPAPNQKPIKRGDRIFSTESEAFELAGKYA
jgi:hypothetical protein